MKNSADSVSVYTVPAAQLAQVVERAVGKLTSADISVMQMPASFGSTADLNGQVLGLDTLKLKRGDAEPVAAPVPRRPGM